MPIHTKNDSSNLEQKKVEITQIWYFSCRPTRQYKKVREVSFVWPGNESMDCVKIIYHQYQLLSEENIHLDLQSELLFILCCECWPVSPNYRNDNWLWACLLTLSLCNNVNVNGAADRGPRSSTMRVGIGKQGKAS